MGMMIDKIIEEDLKHCSFNGVKYSDYVKEHYIPKDQYENRLKADIIAILTEIKLKITEKSYYDTTIIGDYEDEVRVNLVELDDVNDIIQEKINTLRGGENECI